jgi:hypothetical protein
MDLETMQMEAMPPGRMAEVVEAVGLNTQQKQAFTNAWNDFAGVTAELLQQQYSTMQQLQAVVGQSVSAPAAVSSGPAHSAAAVAAAASSDLGTPGPAHLCLWRPAVQCLQTPPAQLMTQQQPHCCQTQ